jgi:iron complex transport system ATP-binding protein
MNVNAHAIGFQFGQCDSAGRGRRPREQYASVGMNPEQVRTDAAKTAGTLTADALGLTRGDTHVLQRIDLRAHPGRLLALVGPDGAGKSSLLAVLAGLLAPTHGSVALDGMPLAWWDARALARRRALLSQTVQMAFGFSAREVALLGRGLDADVRRHADDACIAEAALRAVRAWHLRDRHYLQLSGGEQRRVQLARVLVQLWEGGDRPAWLLLDEPEAGLDVAHRHFVLRLARRMVARGYGVIAVLRDLNLAARYADDVALLAQGRLLRYGSPGHVLDAGTLSCVYGIGMRRTPVNGTAAGRPAAPG